MFGLQLLDVHPMLPDDLHKLSTSRALSWLCMNATVLITQQHLRQLENDCGDNVPHCTVASDDLTWSKPQPES